MKLLLVREEYLMCCSRKYRSEIAWFRADIWKLGGMRKGFENGRCPLCN
jgi:hypothetical protein